MTQFDLPTVAHAVEQSIAANTCTPETVLDLRQLLGIDASQYIRQAASTTRNARKDAAKLPARTPARIKGNATKPRQAADRHGAVGPLESAARTTLATKIVNGSLKALTVVVRKQAGSKVTASRSLNGKEPLQPLSPNAQSNAVQSTKSNRHIKPKISPRGIEHANDHVVSLAECSRVALEFLRQAGDSRNGVSGTPFGQIELGMSSLISKLLALGLDALASRELCSLLPRLQAQSNTVKNTRVKSASKVQSDSPLTDLLGCAALPDDQRALEVLITSHIQALKLLSKIPQVSAIERILHHLESNGTSVLAAVDKFVALTSTNTLSKASRWLDQIAQALDSFAAIKATSGAPGLLSTLTFRCRVLACRIRLQSWTRDDTGRSIHKYILDPFTTSTSAFALDRNFVSAEKYALLKQGTHLFLEELAQSIKGSTSADSYYLTSAKVYRVLADIARESRNYNIAFEWLEKALQLPSITSSVKCALACLLASTHIQQSLSSHSTNQLFTALRDASEHLKLDLKGSAADMDDVFVSAASLRKQAVCMLLRDSSAAEQTRMKENKSLPGLCKETILRCVRFFIRYAQGIESQQRDQHERRHERQYGLAAKSLVPTVEALAAVTNATLAEDTASWEDTMQCLQECRRLISKFDLPSTKASEHQSRHPSVTISNTFWCRYLKRKSQASKYNEPISLLKQAIDALSTCSYREQDIGFLYLKYEKLGSLLESQADLEGALSKYSMALGAILTFHSTAGTFNKSDPFLEITTKPQTGSLARLRPLITSYTRIQGKLATSSAREFIAFQPQLRPIVDGCVLELQLTAALDSLKTDPCLVPSSSLEKLYTLLKETYADAIFPAQRVHLKLLRGMCIEPACYPDGFFELLQESCGTLSSRIAEQDEGYKPFKDQHDMYTVLFRRESALQRMPAILAIWQEYIKSDRAKILSCPEFLEQLQLLQNYLFFHGNEVWLAQVTSMLMDLQKGTSSPADQIHRSAVLARQLTRLGHCELARKHLSQTEQVVENATDETQIAAIDWHLAYSEYLLDVGNTRKCHETLLLTERLFGSRWTADGGGSPTLWDRYQQLYFTAQTLHLNATLNKAIGNPARALYYAKKSTRVTHRAWAVMEKYQNARNMPEASQATAKTTKSQPRAATEGASVSSNEHSSLQQASFWMLGPLIYAHTANLAYLLADEGQLLEARYYAEKAEKLAQTIASARLLAEAIVLKTHLLRLGGEPASDITALQQTATEPSGLCCTTHADVQLALAESLHQSQQSGIEAETLKHVELILSKSLQPPLDVLSPPPQDIDALHQGMAALNIQSQPKSKHSRPPGKSAPRRPKEVMGVQAPSNSDIANRCQRAEHGPIIRRQGQRLRQSAMLALKLKDFDLAGRVLQEASTTTMLPIDSVKQALCNIRLSIDQAVSMLAKDPVFSLIQESSIMHPSVSLNKDTEGMSHSIASISGKGGKSVTTVRESRQTPKSPNSHAEVIDRLTASTQYLLRASRDMQAHLNTSMGHTCSDSLLKAQLMLSVAGSSSPKAAITSASLAYSLEYGRCLAYMREAASIVADRLLDSEKDTTTTTNSDLVGEEFETSQLDAFSFQSRFLDALPPQWSVISISVSADHEELRISRIRRCSPPMTLSIPLSRHNPRDCEDGEPFGFDEGKAELLEIVSLANYSAHESVDLTKKGAKTAWWETRAALDARLNDLINNVQNMWIGGFQGIFSQHAPPLDLLARFQTTLNNTLNKHLPSRQKTRKGAASQPVSLDIQVLELFIGLGHPASHPDLDTALLDLFYFVVDILQFHGERNAYDEIEFDPMILETLEALTHYHNAADELQNPELPKHTILVLDKCLHAFPWESLPCLAGQSISRVPSLSCLRDRILMQEAQGSTSAVFEADVSSGTYVLNPSGDLSSTHKMFASPLSSLTSWDATVKSLPTEADITTALSSKALYLYFGHGSGAQYVRSRAIRKLKQCAVALLMGCSSGSLVEAGELESHGPLMAYLHAGSPAVVGTLWDVTDKDIDRFAMNTLERWGLFEAKPEGNEKGKGRKAKGKAPAEPARVVKPVSLDQAVAESRQSCILKYLNGAAPVVYGIPVVLK